MKAATVVEVERMQQPVFDSEQSAADDRSDAEAEKQAQALEAVRFIDIIDELTETDEMMLINRIQQCRKGAAHDVFEIFSAAHNRAVKSVAASIAKASN